MKRDWLSWWGRLFFGYHPYQRNKESELHNWMNEVARAMLFHQATEWASTYIGRNGLERAQYPKSLTITYQVPRTSAYWITETFYPHEIVHLFAAKVLIRDGHCRDEISALPHAKSINKNYFVPYFGQQLQFCWVSQHRRKIHWLITYGKCITLQIFYFVNI